MVTAETYPMFETFYSCEKSVLRKYSVLAIEKFPSLILARNAIMLQHFIIQFPPYYLSSSDLWKVKNKRKFQTFSSKSVGGCLQEVVAYKRFQL